MEAYIRQYDSFNTNIIYEFHLGDGGIGDNIKFFMLILESCMKNNIRLYYKKLNIEIENYIKLKYNIMYITEDAIKTLNNVKIVTPTMYHSSIDFNYSIPINQVFYFSDEVIINSKSLFPSTITDYISIHVRLGDKYLETDRNFILCAEDTRSFSEEKIYRYIEDHHTENIFFCCDNNHYKLKLKEKYNNIIVTNCDIGHSSLSNTSTKQIIDAVTEFYILTNSKTIYGASHSGFSLIASKFNNIPFIQ